MASVRATIIVGEIITDLQDRKGLKQAWEAIDPFIREEIVETWKKIVDEYTGER